MSESLLTTALKGAVNDLRTVLDRIEQQAQHLDQHADHDASVLRVARALLDLGAIRGELVNRVEVALANATAEATSRACS